MALHRTPGLRAVSNAGALGPASVSSVVGLKTVTKALDILEVIAMGVCIGYCLICWGADLGQFGNMHPGVRCQILYPPGLATSAIGFVAALFAYRRRRKFALFALGACALFFVWLLLPRL